MKKWVKIVLLLVLITLLMLLSANVLSAQDFINKDTTYIAIVEYEVNLDDNTVIMRLYKMDDSIPDISNDINNLNDYNNMFTRTWRLENESLLSEGSYLNGEKNGEWKTYYKNGNIAYKSKYNLGNEYGIWKFYNKRGKVIYRKYLGKK